MAEWRSAPTPRRDLVIVLGWLLLPGIILGLACTEAQRYRTLCFFFDGVPVPGSRVEAPSEPDPTELDADALVQETAPAEELPPTPEPEPQPGAIRRHPPYRDYRCGSCHDTSSGRLLRTPQEGLCRQCHENVPGDLRYVHGPVAVDACLFCHHPHGGQFAMQLRAEPADVCLRCHDADDVREGAHHAVLDESACTDCHSGHGGSERFFLKALQP